MWISLGDYYFLFVCSCGVAIILYEQAVSLKTDAYALYAVLGQNEKIIQRPKDIGIGVCGNTRANGAGIDP